jgi:hypothetical protein
MTCVTRTTEFTTVILIRLRHPYTKQFKQAILRSLLRAHKHVRHAPSPKLRDASPSKHLLISISSSKIPHQIHHLLYTLHDQIHHALQNGLPSRRRLSLQRQTLRNRRFRRCPPAPQPQCLKNLVRSSFQPVPPYEPTRRNHSHHSRLTCCDPSRPRTGHPRASGHCHRNRQPVCGVLHDAVDEEVEAERVGEFQGDGSCESGFVGGGG